MNHRWIPKVGDFINIQLPGELIRGTVQSCPDENSVIVHINISHPISKQHKYNHNDMIAAIRDRDEIGQEIWRVVDEL